MGRKEIDLTLPVELLIVIFLKAAGANRAVAAQLCRVSKWVRAIVEPILYQVLAFNATPLTQVLQRLNHQQSRSSLRALGIINGSADMFNGIGGLTPIRNIHNFAIDGLYSANLVDLPHVEELHLLTNCNFGRMNFPRMKRLHYSGLRVAPLAIGAHQVPPTNGILNQPGLKYIAFSVPEDQNMASLFLAIKPLLSEHKSLALLLLVRVLHSTSLVLRGHTTSADYEFIEGHLVSMGDPRLFFQRVNVEARSGSLLKEWEENARTGQSIWIGLRYKWQNEKQFCVQPDHSSRYLISLPCV